MQLGKTRAWLDEIIGGKTPTDQDVESITKCAEDLHLNFKSGKHSKPTEVLLENMAAFANSDGGTLIIGYDESAGAFDGFTGKGPLASWAANVVGPKLGPYLSRPPRFHEVVVRGAAVLVASVARSDRFVTLIQQGELVYYLRIADSTIRFCNFKAPEYLRADLALGRRNSPALRPRVATRFSGNSESGGDIRETHLVVTCKVENEGLSFRARRRSWGSSHGALTRRARRASSLAQPYGRR